MTTRQKVRRAHGSATPTSRAVEDWSDQDLDDLKRMMARLARSIVLETAYARSRRE